MTNVLYNGEGEKAKKGGENHRLKGLVDDITVKVLQCKEQH
jgi:hypothetical protein